MTWSTFPREEVLNSSPGKDKVMARQSASIECSNCANICVVHGIDADTVQFCPFCGDDVLLSYDDINTSNLLGGDFDEDDNDDDE